MIGPNLNDTEENIQNLSEFIKKIKNVEKVELLPYKTIGVHKYGDLGIKYRLEGVPDMDEQKCKKLEKKLISNLKN